ncbi:hypothetical protein CKA32_001727 [Geitlerinema sp. FC II]|nr:hypothetical protein CKA32_001727 [Geitlerinema sp. FC II]
MSGSAERSASGCFDKLSNNMDSPRQLRGSMPRKLTRHTDLSELYYSGK